MGELAEGESTAIGIDVGGATIAERGGRLVGAGEEVIAVDKRVTRNINGAASLASIVGTRASKSS